MSTLAAPVRKRFVVAGAVLAGLTSAALWFGGHATWADAATLRARWIIAEWREGKGPSRQPEVLARVAADLQAGTRITPGNAALYDDLGFLHAFQAEALSPYVGEPALRDYQRQLLVTAAGHYRTSTALRPTFPYSWAYLALAKHMLEEYDGEYWVAFDKAHQLGRAEAGVQVALARMAFARWQELSPERKDRMVAMVLSAQPKVAGMLRALADGAGAVLPAP
nr:hypothetical protein [uncultured Rhodoferax sp.]